MLLAFTLIVFIGAKHIYALQSTSCFFLSYSFHCHIFHAQKGKGKGLDTCYSATYISQTRDQQRFTISEVAADWHEPKMPQRIMWPSITRANGQLDQQCN